MTDLPTIFADFQNADPEGFVRLNTNGTRSDLDRAALSLVVGLRLCLSDGELLTEAVVVAPGTEGIWRTKIDWRSLFSQD